MQQVLLRIPVADIHLHAFWLMLVIAVFDCTWLARRRADREGIPRERIQDLAIWIFLGGVIGARIVYMIQYKQPIQQFFRLWEGGIVFYGGALGGLIGYIMYRVI